ncbi:MAG: hypothetical protein KY468_06895, partial [Armatimonadetes bacterium]|nr:hypothetical protein [Armatimonadota bacterium]
MKRLYLLFFTAGLMLETLFCGAAGAAQLSLSPSQSHVTAGTTVNVDVILISETNLTGVQFTLDLGSRHSSPYSPSLALGSIPDDALVSPYFPSALISTQPNLTSDTTWASPTLRVAIAGTDLRKGKNKVLTVPLRIPSQAAVGAQYFLMLREAYGSNALGQNERVAVMGSASLYVQKSAYPTPPSSSQPTQPVIQPRPMVLPSLIVSRSPGAPG